MWNIRAVGDGLKAKYNQIETTGWMRSSSK